MLLRELPQSLVVTDGSRSPNQATSSSRSLENWNRTCQASRVSLRLCRGRDRPLYLTDVNTQSLLKGKLHIYDRGALDVNLV